MKTLISFIIFISAFSAQAGANFYGYSQDEINNAREVSTLYGAKTYVEERNAFNNALLDYFIDINYRNDYKSIRVTDFKRLKEGVWWKKDLAGRRTVYELQFNHYGPSDFRHDECKVRFSREELQTYSKAVKAHPATLSCVTISDSPF